MKIYKTMLTRNYVNDWTVADGIREVIQNNLDSPAVFQYDIGLDYIELTSVGITLDISIFLLGESGKRNDPNSVGKKGEGSLVSMIPLLRNNCSITIYNGNKVWTPEFVFDEDFNKEVLAIKEEIVDNGNTDYKVLITNVEQDDLDLVVENCLYLQPEESLGNYATASCGSRVFFEKKGKVYVGGLFVCDTDLSYVYDFHPSKLPLNRDRKQVDTWSLQGETARVLKEVADAARIVELAKSNASDVNHFQYTWRATSEEASELAYKEFKETYGESALLADDYDHKLQMEKEGYKDVVLVKQDSYRQLIQNSESYREYFQSVEIENVGPEEEKTPTEMLEDLLTEVDLFGQEAKFDELLKLFKERGVSWNN